MQNRRLRTGFWFAPAFFGIVLVLFGVLIFVRPAMLNYLVATAFILAGISLLTIAAQMRVRVKYRRMDEPFPPQE